MNDTMTLRSRIAGSLYGLLAGDALGCPVEGWSPSQIQSAFGVLDAMRETRKRWRPAGLHSDDGQQALALCDGILENPAAPHRGFARIIVEMSRAGTRSWGCHRGTGTHFRNSLRALALGAEPWEAAQASAGNGTAMLIAPVAWYWRDDLDALAEQVVAVARVKQSDVRGIAGAGAIAWLVAHGLREGSFATLDADAFVSFVRRVESTAAEGLGGSEHLGTFSAALAEMLGHRRRSREQVLERIAETASRTASRRCYAGSGYAPASAITAAYLAITSESFEQAVVDAVNLGGDTDTVGAMTGAASGAAFGREMIPQQWYDALHARDAFEDRIDAMVERHGPWTPARRLANLEHDWNERMEAIRRGTV